MCSKIRMCCPMTNSIRFVNRLKRNWRHGLIILSSKSDTEHNNTPLGWAGYCYPNSTSYSARNICKCVASAMLISLSPLASAKTNCSPDNVSSSAMCRWIAVTSLMETVLSGCVSPIFASPISIHPWSFLKMSSKKHPSQLQKKQATRDALLLRYETIVFFTVADTTWPLISGSAPCTYHRGHHNHPTRRSWWRLPFEIRIFRFQCVRIFLSSCSSLVVTVFSRSTWDWTQVSLSILPVNAQHGCAALSQV